MSEADHAARLHDAFLDATRAEVPEKSSALLLFAATTHVDAMVAAFDGRGGRVVRHHLTADAAAELEGAVAGYPRVAGP
jgi:uncharacterized membrane protein